LQKVIVMSMTTLLADHFVNWCGLQVMRRNNLIFTLLALFGQHEYRIDCIGDLNLLMISSRFCDVGRLYNRFFL
jgi:hypothetical protein